VWALNKAASQPRAVGELTNAVDRLRRAQLGQGELRPAIERYRAALEALVRTATELLGKAGIRVSSALERRLQSTLLVAITDRRLRADLAAGLLAQEGDAPGFEVLTQGPIPAEFLRARPATAARTSRRATAPAAEVERPRAHSTKAELQRPEREDRKAARQAERQVKALDKAAGRKEQAADTADRKLEALRTALREQERRAALMRTSADEARAAHRTVLERSRTSRDAPR
jgi:hypothetical protein